MAQVTELKLFIDAKWQDGETIVAKTDTWSGSVAANVHIASKDQVSRATRAVADGQASINLSPYDRYLMLMRASELLSDRRDSFVDAIITDTGFTEKDAAREVERAVETLIISAEESKRLRGEIVPMGSDPGNPKRMAFTILKPVGVVCAITPFNSPLNTVLHKIAPALAAGNGIVLKPALQTPITANLLIELLLDAGVPPELMSLVHGSGRTVGQWLLEDPIPAFYAFTGSTSVGEVIQRTIGVRRAQLELGSLASTIVCGDADLARAASLSINAAFRKAGQVCTSVQRLYVHESVIDEFTALLVAGTADKKAGDPRDQSNFLGPLIDIAAAKRVDRWVNDAILNGATLHAGGKRDEAVIAPTVLGDVPLEAEVMCKEVFGPVVTLRSFSDLDVAIDEVNATPYGLAAGIFTESIHTAMRSAPRLRVGTVHVNETSSARVDLMPFGGVKKSGHGKEGPSYAIREMSEETLITIGS